MEIGLFTPLGNGNASAEILRTLGREAEERGFESIWVAEHVVLFDDYESQYPYSPDGRFPGGGDTGLLEPLTALTYLAAVTDRIRLGTGICLVPQRNPVYTAKQVVDLDNLSGGRVDFGIGVGWLQEEFDALNTPFERRGEAHRRVPAGHAVALDRGDVVVLGRALRPAARAGCTRSRCSRRTRRCTSAARATPPSDGPPGSGRVGTRSTAAGRPGRAARHPRRLPGGRGPRRDDEDFQLSVCPYFQPVDAATLEAYRDAGVDRVVLLCLAFDVDGLRRQLDDLAALL